MLSFPIYPPHAKWIRESCARHCWPEVRRTTEKLVALGETVPNALHLLDRFVRDFNNHLNAGEAGEGLLIVKVPAGMTLEAFQGRLEEVFHGH